MFYVYSTDSTLNPTHSMYFESLIAALLISQSI